MSGLALRECTALVTGGAVRVGRAIVRTLAERGAGVGFTYLRSEGAALELLAELDAAGCRSCAVRCDQAEPGQVRDAFERIEGSLGPVDLLINNAAVFERTPFETAAVEAWDYHLDTNLRGPWLFCQAAAPGMQSRGRGVIINLLDIAAERPYLDYLPYSISKAGLAALTRGLARALAPHVRVNGIAIGTVAWPDGFPIEEQQRIVARTPLHRIGDPEEVARAVAYLIEEAGFVTGAILPLDGGRLLT
jgi:NAD(P)-dependent dehydrogenase (short-subunit alcohol dehydrogenase family)